MLNRRLFWWHSGITMDMIITILSHLANKHFFTTCRSCWTPAVQAGCALTWPVPTPRRPQSRVLKLRSIWPCYQLVLRNPMESLSLKNKFKHGERDLSVQFGLLCVWGWFSACSGMKGIEDDNDRRPQMQCVCTGVWNENNQALHFLTGGETLVYVWLNPAVSLSAIAFGIMSIFVFLSLRLMFSLVKENKMLFCQTIILQLYIAFM